jgi:site-specific DNA-cytosine methylase
MFNVSLLEDMFNGAYHWQAHLLCGTSFGHPVRRKRFYAVGHNRATVGKALRGERTFTMVGAGPLLDTQFCSTGFLEVQLGPSAHPRPSRVAPVTLSLAERLLVS